MISPYSFHKKSFRESGFTLLELLLVIGVSALLLLGISQITRSWVDSESASGAGQHLQRVSTIVQRYINANMDKLTDATTSPETADALVTGTTTPGSPWEGLPALLSEEGLLTGGVLRSPLGVTLKISYVIDNTVIPKVYRAAIRADSDMPIKRALETARQAGNVGGTISAFPDGSNAVGAFGQWKVAKNKLLPAGADPCAASNTPGNPRGCLIAILSFNDTMLHGPYLYREKITDFPELNRMSTDLDMNNNDVTGAKLLATEDLNVSTKADLGTTTVNGGATFNSDATVTNGVEVTGDMNVSGDAVFTKDVSINATGNVTAHALNADTVEAPALRTNTLDAQNMTIDQGSLTVDDNVNVNGDVTMTEGGGEVFAATVNSGTINANDGELRVGKMEVQNRMDVTGTLNVTGDARVRLLAADECVRIAKGDGTYDPYGPSCPP